MSLFTEDMRMITAVVLEECSDEVIKALLELGALDFVQIKNLPPSQLAKLSHRNPNVSKAGIIDTRHRIGNLLRQGGRPVPSSSQLDVKEMTSLDLKDYRAQLDKLSRSLGTLKDQQKTYSQLEQSLTEMRRYLQEGQNDYVDIRVGTITGNLDALKKRLGEYGAVISEKDGHIATMTLRRDAQNVSDAMEVFGWTESADRIVQQEGDERVKANLDKRIEDAIAKKTELEQQVADKIGEHEQELTVMWCNLRLHELSDQIRSYFSYTKNTTLFSGWVPSYLADKVEAAIETSSNGQCIIDWTEVNEVPRETVPVAMKSPAVLRPFERIVRNYGTPEYGTVNPTPFVAVAYMTMFLLMFADIGQGIVILLIGWLTGRLYSKHPEMKDGIIPRSVCTLIEYVGIASIIGGILFGSNFGFPVPALWFNYHSVVMGHPLPGTPVQNIYDILGISIYYGLIVIFVGLGINWTNLIRKKNWIKLFFDRQGFSGVAIYIVGLYIGFSYTYSGFKSFPSDPWIAWVLLAAALGMLARRPLEYILDRKAGKVVQPFGPFLANALMMWLIELLETFTGYLSNTLSFFRVAGLGIAHVSLMGAFESLAEIPGLHSIGGIAILVAGNALVIALEGLSTGIQALRLNYYEFFTKFFNGTGIAYSPVSLRSKDRS